MINPSKYLQKESVSFQETPSFQKSPNTLKPYFDFQYIDRKNIKKIAKEDWEQFTKKLRMLKDRSWDEINSSSKGQFGYETIPIKNLRKPLNNPFDENKVYVFKYSQKGRFLGYKKQDIFYIIKVDPTHEYDK